MLGLEDDVRRFTELITQDFHNRAQKAAEKVFKGRIQLLPPEGELEDPRT